MEHAYNLQTFQQNKMKKITHLLVLLVFWGLCLDIYAQVDRPPAGLTFVPSSDSGPQAQTIKSLKIRAEGDSVFATIEGDGVLLYGIYMVPSPPRLVVDLLGVQSRLKTQLLPKPHPYFERVRSYEYPQTSGTEATDQSFTRIIFDVKIPVDYRVTPDGKKITIELIPNSEQAESSTQIVTKPDTPETKPDTKSEIKPDTSNIKTDTAPQIKPDTTPQIKPDTTPQIKPDTTPQIKPDTTPVINPMYASAIEPKDVNPNLFFGQAPPASSEYRLGPEDVIQVSVFQLADLNVTARVSGTGSVTLPLIGTLAVQGKTAGEVGQDIAKLLGEKYLQNPQVTVFITEFNSQKVSVIGRLQNSGSYPLLGSRTIIQLIAQAGGVADGAGKTLFVFRQAPDGRSARLSIPIEDLLVHGDPNWNIWVKAGDVISIPPLEQISVSVLGAVATPGTITFSGGEGATLLNAVARAGGLKGASKSGIKIKRRNASGTETIIEADLGDIISGKKPDVKLENGDVVVIKESFF